MLTIVLACYGQPKMMAFQMETLANYPDHIKSMLRYRIVDDHGDPEFTIDESFAKEHNVQVYRVLEDIPWAQMGARNVGMRESPDGPCLLLDPDMVIPKDRIPVFIERAQQLPRGHVIKFGLNHVSGGRDIDYSSPNTWLIHRADFFDCGGYDEDFRGHKGWSDCLLQETLRGFYTVKDDLSLFVDFYLPSDGYDDAMVMSLDRDVSFNKALKIRKNEFIRKVGGFRRYIKKGLKGPNFRCRTERVR